MFSALFPAYVPRGVLAPVVFALLPFLGGVLALQAMPIWAFFVFLYSTICSQKLKSIQNWSPARFVPGLLTNHLIFSLSMLATLSAIYILITPAGIIDSSAIALFAIALGINSAFGIVRHILWLIIPFGFVIINDSSRQLVVELMQDPAWNLILILLSLFLLWQIYRQLNPNGDPEPLRLKKIVPKLFVRRSKPLRPMSESTAQHAMFGRPSINGWLGTFLLYVCLIFWSYDVRHLNPDSGILDILQAIIWFGTMVSVVAPIGFIQKVKPLQEFLWLSGATSTYAGVTMTLFRNCLRPSMGITCLLMLLVLTYWFLDQSGDLSFSVALILSSPAAASLLLGCALQNSFDQHRRNGAPVSLMILMGGCLVGYYWFAYWASQFPLVELIFLCVSFSVLWTLLSLGVSILAAKKRISF